MKIIRAMRIGENLQGPLLSLVCILLGKSAVPESLKNTFFTRVHKKIHVLNPTNKSFDSPKSLFDHIPKLYFCLEG
jgi:hypothetical protein